MNNASFVHQVPWRHTSFTLLLAWIRSVVFEKGLWAPTHEHPSAQRPFSKTTTFTDDWGDLNAYHGDKQVAKDERDFLGEKGFRRMQPLLSEHATPQKLLTYLNIQIDSNAFVLFVLR